MPNWAIGIVEVTGIKQGVYSFVDRFANVDKQNTYPHKKFYRSYTDVTCAEMRRQVAEAFRNLPDDAVRTFSFMATFAWELDACMMAKAPMEFEQSCLTVGDACKEDGVQVEIHTSEPSNDLEEWIICKEDGKAMYGCQGLKAFCCKKCGNIQSLASFEDPSDTECAECGNVGFESYIQEEACM